MRRSRFSFGGVTLGVVGTVGVLMLIPGGDGNRETRQTALATSPELAAFLDKAIEPRPVEKTSAEVIAEVAAAPEPGQPAPVQGVAVPQAVAATAGPDQEPSGSRELVTARTAVNMRSGPSTASPTLFVLQPDEEVAIIERQGSWARVEKTSGATGWVYGRYLGNGTDDVDTTATGSVQTAEVTKPRVERPSRQREERARERGTVLASVRLRAGPSRAAPTIGTVEPGTPLRVAERRNGWARVVVPGGISGWVRVN